MPKEYAVDGATLECKWGDSKSKLAVLPTSRVKVGGKCKTNITDCKPMVNVKPCGKCKSMLNPAVAAATAAAQGKLQPMPCTPACSIWIGGKTNDLVGKKPALMKGDKTVCPLGVGMIQVKDSGQGSGKPGGPYAHLDDLEDVGSGKDFTQKQKSEIIKENMKKNNGDVKSDLSGEKLVKPKKSQKGVTPDPNEWQIDHIVSKDKGGSNSYSNAQVLSRNENRIKWNK